MYFILFYKTVENYLERRLPYREEHLAYAKRAQENGSLFLAGALTDPANEAILVFKTDTSAIPEEFARHDPYVINGLITEWYVRKWTVVIGSE